MPEMNSESFSLRPATEDDLPLVLEIERVSYKRPWSREAFFEEMTRPYSQFLVLTDDETDNLVAAYVVYWLLFEECHILNVAVHLQWRGLGFAERLVRKAIDDALRKNMKRVFLEVRKSNAAATALYQKLGFFIDHIKPRFYEDGEDAYFMVLFLQKQNTF
ncbi:MAG: ribosomal protein S18-alanine N-acetyltransferase [Bdellovibrionota bacterium]